MSEMGGLKCDQCGGLGAWATASGSLVLVACRACRDRGSRPTELVEAHATIARLEEELQASFADLAELGADIRRLSDENARLRLILGELVVTGPVAIYGTDFPECPDASMHQPVEAPEQPTALVTRWRNGKRYELTPEDARRFDEGEMSEKIVR